MMQLSQHSDQIMTLAGLLLTLLVFSLFLGDNWLSRLAGSILNGAMSAYVCLTILNDFLIPAFRDTTAEKPSIDALIIMILVLVSSAFLFCRFFTPSRDAGKITVQQLLTISSAILVFGAASGTLPAFFNGLSDVFLLGARDLIKGGQTIKLIRALILIFSALTTLSVTRHYDLLFQESENKEPPIIEIFTEIGRWIVMFSLGAAAAGCLVTSSIVFIKNLERVLEMVQHLLG